MNAFEILVLVFAVVMLTLLTTRGRRIRRAIDCDPRDSAEVLRLKDEVTELKERIKVLERITVDKENSLAHQIDALREHDRIAEKDRAQ